MNFQQIKHDNELLRNEIQVCKRKLDSKCEALQILTRDLDQSRQQRDQFKLMAEQVQARYQALKRQVAGVSPRGADGEKEFSRMRSEKLPQLLSEMRDYSKTLQFERDDLAQKLKDAQGDVKILRQQIARQRVGDTDEGMNTRHFPAHEREKLVKQLEASQEQIVQLERDIEQMLCEKEDQETERDVYKTKYESLNRQLNRILQGTDDRVVDIDAIINQNKFLQERLNTLEEEKQIAQATVSKYKSLLDKKKQKGILKVGQSRTGGLVISQKQVSELLAGQMPPTPQMVADLQSIASALLDTVSDKNTALSHQRKANRVLGNRVTELEERVHSLEREGFSNTQGRVAGLDKLKLECEEIRGLLPAHTSDQESDGRSSELGDESKDTTPCSSSQATPTHVNGSHVTGSHVIPRTSAFSLEELDLLPTKDHSQALHEHPDEVRSDRSVMDSFLEKHLDRTDFPVSSNFDAIASKLSSQKEGRAGPSIQEQDDDVFDPISTLDLVQDQRSLSLDNDLEDDDLDLQLCAKTEEFESFMDNASSKIQSAHANLDAEFDTAANQLQDLMEAMTSKVKERSRSDPDENKDVNVNQKPVDKSSDIASDKSPLLQEKDGNKKNDEIKTQVGV